MFNIKRYLLSLLLLSAAAGSAHIFADDMTPEIKVSVAPKPKSATAGVKSKMAIKQGDCELSIGGKTKIEHYFSKNLDLLNDNIPNQSEYFKHTTDVSLDFAFGQEKFDHKAIEAFTKIRNKSIWGRGSVFADSDSSLPVNLKLGKETSAVFGDHKHQNGKPLLWIIEGWLQFSFNAIVNSPSECRHYLKLGWFPFDLGRGIALGGFYGLSREALGLYGYPEDKSAPGINLHGDFIKDVLSYDVYYAKFEERDKGLSDTLNNVKEQLLGRKATPYRGVGKDNELIAGRVKWKALDNNCGSLDLEPYIFYNEASDQKVEILADSKTEFGSFGLAAEYKYKGFEVGGEVAFNYGNEFLRGIDRNVIKMVRNSDGTLAEVFSFITDTNTGDLARVTTASKAAARVQVTSDAQPLPGTFQSNKGRIRNCKKVPLRGYMGVIDAQYTFDKADLTIAGAYGYASGDKNPNLSSNSCEKYKGFIGLHENYTGKRVNSVILLDERLIKVPAPLTIDDEPKDANEDFAFTDLQHVGVSMTWTPTFKEKHFSINPNLLFFWRTFPTKKVIVDPTNSSLVTLSPCDARKFMGTEFNILSSVELLKGLKFFVNMGGFFPGTYFKDINGLPLDNNYFARLSESLGGEETDGINQQTYGIGFNNAFYSNIGFEFSF